MTAMNNNLVPFGSAITRTGSHELSEATKALMGASSGYRLSIKGGVFRLLSNGKEYAKIPDRHLDVVIVTASPHVSRVFYMQKWDDEAPPQAPDCVSRDGDTPDARSAHPQAKRCNDCPQNAKGSGQGDSKACRYNQALAIVLANDISGNVLKFQVPAASIFGKGEGAGLPLRECVTQLAANQPPANVDEVIMRLYFDLESSSPKLFFKPEFWLNDAQKAIVRKQGQTEAAKRAIETTVFEADGTSAAPPLAIAGTRPTAEVAPAPEPEPEPAETEEEREAREFAEFKAAKAAKAGNGDAKPRGRPKKDAAVVEPTVRAAAPAAAAPGRADLSKVLDQWDAPGGSTDD